MDTPNFAMIELKNIRIDGGTQQRPLSQEGLNLYQERHEGGEDFPAVETVFDGKDHWLWDGFHRYHVACKMRDTVIMAHVTTGTQRDAVWLSFSANKDHGVQRPKGCASEIIRKILADPEWSQVPQTKIARHVGVSQQLVARVSASYNMLYDAQGTANADDTRAVTRKGKKFKMKVGRIGRRSKGTSAVSKQACKPVRKTAELVPMLSISLPVNNPQMAAKGMLSRFEKPFLAALVKELSALLQEGTQS